MAILFYCSGYLMGSRLYYIADDMAKRLESGGPLVVIPPVMSVACDVVLKCLRRNSV